MNLLDLERIVSRGAASLAEGLHFYWPTASVKNEIHEANITLHMGRAILGADFLAFSEANPAQQARVHIDLIGLHPPTKMALLCEFKRLYNPDKAKEMIADVGRILNFNLQTNIAHVHERLNPQSFRRFGLVAATTWNEGYANWFASTSHIAPHPTLSPLWAAIPGEEKVCGAFPLSYSHDPGQDKSIQHWLVYILFEMLPAKDTPAIRRASRSKKHTKRS